MIGARFYTIYLWLAFSILDIIVTHLGLQQGHIEGNPLPRFPVERFGELRAYGFKMGLVLGAMAVKALLARSKAHAWLILRIVNVVCLAVLRNLIMVL